MNFSCLGRGAVLGTRPLRMAMLLCALGIAPPTAAQAQATLKIVVASPPGGGLDALARALAAGLRRASSTAVVVENRPGGGGIIGSDFVAKAPADGRTLLLATGFVPLSTVLFKAPYDALADFSPVVELPGVHTLLMARKGLAMSTLADVARVAAQTPGGLNCAGYVGEPQLGCELLRHLLGGSMVTVPYAGLTPAAQALAAGQVDLMILPYDYALALHEGGRAVAFANVGSRAAPPPFDRLPLMKERWPEFVMDGVMGILAPAGTPAHVLRQLNQQFLQVLQEPAMRETLAARGSVPFEPGPPERLAQRMRDKLAQYRHLASTLGIKP